MGKISSTQARSPVLVCTDQKEDIPVLQSVLIEQGSDALICLDVADLCAKISDQAQAAFIRGVMLSAEDIDRITATLDAQPDWSDLPVILSVEGGAAAPAAVDAMSKLGNVLVLDCPFTPAALRSMLLVAFRSRERQRWIRDLTKECEHAVMALQESRDQLEQRIRERTNALEEKTSQLRLLTGELILSEQRERRRIAKVLHDNLQQILVSAKYRAATLGRSEDPTTKVAGREIEELVGEAIKESRTLGSELNPAVIREGDLRTAMEWLVSYMAAENSLPVELRMDENFGQLDENAKILLFESTRELLSNAARHGKAPNAEVRVHSRPDENMLQIDVLDQGAGFDPSALSKKGFGLWRVRSRLELVGGRLEINSSVGKGSRLSIMMPLPETTPVQTKSPAEISTPRSEKFVSSMIRLLIVDDHAVMRQGLSTSLGQEPDIAIIGEAADGKTALEKVRKLRPDVVLMDLGMPKMGGIEATKIIHSEMPGVRVIGLSMFEERERAYAMIEAGAVAYLSKSCSVDTLTSTIRRSVGKPELPVG